MEEKWAILNDPEILHEIRQDVEFLREIKEDLKRKIQNLRH